MASNPRSQPDSPARPGELPSESIWDRIRNIPWWLVGLFLVSIGFAFIIVTRQNFREAFEFIIGGVSIQGGVVEVSGIALTIFIALVAYFIAVLIGLLVGLGRVSGNVILSNTATFYVEFIRGIPMLVLIFFIVYVAVPAVVGAINSFGVFLADSGIPNPLVEVKNENVSILARAIVALSTTYGAFLAEIFRAGIQSIGKGQMEAARSLGMSYGQAMRYVILPQAIRNVLPALGNDFVAMVKDSSLVSAVAVREITQVARLYAGRSFRFPEAYTTLSILYLTMTVVLSLFVRLLERRMRSHD